MHRGYTIQFFIDVIKTLPEKAIATDFYKALSPRDGFASDKSMMLDFWLGNSAGANTRELIEGKRSRAKKLGKTAKQRLINALKNRQQGVRYPS